MKAFLKNFFGRIGAILFVLGFIGLVGFMFHQLAKLVDDPQLVSYTYGAGSLVIIIYVLAVWLEDKEVIYDGKNEKRKNEKTKT